MIRRHLGHGSDQKERAVIHGIRGQSTKGAQPQVYT
jgi:hypothetical protein